MTLPHKNHVRLLHALARLRDEHQIRLPLVCAGRIYAPHWITIDSARRTLRLEDQVHFLGAVSDRMQASLFESARFVVFPSLFEGLGLPLVEALQLGVPVVAADATCIPEVVQDAGILFNGESVDAIVAALRAALEGRCPSARVPGAPTLARFSWSRAIQTFIGLYRAAAGWPLSNAQRRLVAEAIEA
jgi:glycosyltransferase involved in cell wall biosynthesis